MTTFSDYGIHIDESKGGNQKVPCPKCSSSRKKSSDPCLSVNADEGVYNCHHCEFKGSIKSDNDGNAKNKIIATYDYKDESDNLLYQSVRFNPKSFRQRRPDEKDGWMWNLKGVQQVPYRLPELLASSDTVYIPGGEKDVETLVKYGLTATTNAGGEGNWKPEFNEYLRGRDVVILEDNDEKGRKHGRIITESLHDIATSIKIVRFKEMDKGGDVSDFLAANTIDDLLGRIKNAPQFSGCYSKYFGEAKSGSDTDCSGKSGECDDEEKTQAQLLIDFTPAWELFHTPEDEFFITFPKEGHEETYLIKSKEIRYLLISLFFHLYGKPPRPQALSDAIGLLEAKAKFGNKEHQVFNRIAALNGNLYLDLCNKHWEAVEVTSNGWKVIPNPPVKFIRTRAMKPIPHPLQDGSVNELKAFINESDDQWKLIVGFLISCLRTKGPFPILCIQGEQGSGKSFICRLLKSIIDPSKALLKTLPTNERDLVITAKNSWILAFDNLSGLKPWISDALCRLSTGGGFATRELYTDADEIIFDSQRSQILNGIDDIAVRADLRDRALIINLPVISQDQRKDEESMLKQFEKARPSILGGLLDAVSSALKNLEAVKLEKPPRMADFAKWVTAAESGLGWESGSFIVAYNENQAAAVGIGLDSDLLAQAMIDFQKDIVEWDGTATELLDALEEKVPEKILKSKQWPKAANALSNRLRRLAPVLREVGIDIELGGRDGKKRNRLIWIRKYSEKTGHIGHTVRQNDNSCENRELVAGSEKVNRGQEGTGADDLSERPVKGTPLENKGGNDADDADDDLPLLSKSQAEIWETSV
jgi:hypothetical protein